MQTISVSKNIWLFCQCLLVGLMALSLGSCCDDCPNCPAPAAPSGWILQDTPTEATLNNIHAFDARTAIAVGESGTVIRTANGGRSWQTVPSGTTEFLRGLSFVDASTGWAVGENGVVIKTTDGGLTWTQQTVPVVTHFREAAFVSASTGWVAGGPVGDQEVEAVIMKTTDGGETWESLPTDFTVRTMSAVDADHAFVAGGGTFMRTIDGGETWEVYDPQPLTWFGCVFFVDRLTGWASGGQGFIAATVDGGINWEPLNSGTGRNVTEMYFLNAENGYYVARPTGTIAVTSDGGSTWRFQTVPSDLSPSDVSFVDADTGWISGGGGLILKTTTGGW